MASSSRRIRILLVMLWIGLAVVAARLFQVQVVEHDAWVQEGSFSRLRVRSLPFRRGAILDRHGKVLARDESAHGLQFHYDAFRRGMLAAQLVEAVEVLGGQDAALSLAEALTDPGRAVARLGELPVRRADREGAAPAISLVQRGLRERIGRDLPVLLSTTTERGGSLTAYRRAIEEAAEDATLEQCFPEGLHRLQAAIAGESADLARLSRQLGEDDPALVADLDAIHRGLEDRVAERAEDGSDPDPRERTVRRRRHEGILRPLRDDVSYDAVLHVDLHASRYPGFVVEDRTDRVYPLGEAAFAPHVIGLVGAPTAEEVERYHEAREELLAFQKGLVRAEDAGTRIERLTSEVREEALREGERRGRTGVEAEYEDVLRGRRGWVKEQRNGAVLERRLPVQGHDLRLTIDTELQLAAERALDEVHPDGAGGVCLLAVDSGEVLALAVRPRFRPDEYRTRYQELASREAGWVLHPRTHRPYFPPAPGSVLKPFVAAAALQEGTIDASTRIECRGVHLGLRCEGVHGAIDVHDAMRLSCNVYFAEVARRMGYETLWGWMRRFGFGETTGLGLGEIAGEVTPRVPPLPGLIRFGVGHQVITVTPVQVARAMAALANRGTLRPVTIVRDAEIRHEASPPRDLDLGETTLRIVHDSMVAVVAPGGTAGPRPDADSLDLRGLGGGIAGKTGTPETWLGSGEDHAWFAGYFPADAPRIAFAVFLENVGEHGRYAAWVVERILRSPAGSQWDDRLADASPGRRP